MNEKGKKEKGIYEISQKQKHDKKEKEEKVGTTESYTKSNLEMEYIAMEPEKKDEIIQQTENEEQNWKESEKDQRDVELTDKLEREYIIRPVNIEKQVKDNLRQNGKKKDREKRSRNNLKCKELKRNKKGKMQIHQQAFKYLKSAF